MKRLQIDTSGILYAVAFLALLGGLVSPILLLEGASFIDVFVLFIAGVATFGVLIAVANITTYLREISDMLRDRNSNASR